jgi:hypothetical protein
MINQAANVFGELLAARAHVNIKLFEAKFATRYNEFSTSITDDRLELLVEAAMSDCPADLA